MVIELRMHLLDAVFLKSRKRTSRNISDAEVSLCVPRVAGGAGTYFARFAAVLPWQEKTVAKPSSPLTMVTPISSKVRPMSPPIRVR